MRKRLLPLGVLHAHGAAIVFPAIFGLVVQVDIDEPMSTHIFKWSMLIKFALQFDRCRREDVLAAESRDMK